MKTSRRNFLKGLLAAGAAALIPQALVEPVHGASDLTPQERDIAADVMGLRRETWTGWLSGPSEFITYPMYEGHWPDGTLRFREINLPRSTPEADAWNLIRSRGQGRTEGHTFLVGPNGSIADALAQCSPSRGDVVYAVPAGPLEIGPNTTIIGVDSAARPSFSFDDALRGDGTDIISDTTPTWGRDCA